MREMSIGKMTYDGEQKNSTGQYESFMHSKERNGSIQRLLIPAGQMRGNKSELKLLSHYEYKKWEKDQS